jgi:hypothetical protein
VYGKYRKAMLWGCDRVFVPLRIYCRGIARIWWAERQTPHQYGIADSLDDRVHHPAESRFLDDQTYWDLKVVLRLIARVL